jgi:benzoyl-CoA reductase subunit C
MEAIEHLSYIAQKPLSQWHDCFPTRRPVGIYNAYVPEEMFHAAGLTPVYIFHQSSDRGHTRTHLPSFVCWPGRSLVDQAVAGDLDGLAGMAFSQSCDTVQALTDIWRKAVPGVPVYHIGMPTHLATPASRPYLIAELNQLRQALGNPSDEALHQAYSVYNQTRELVARLFDRAGDLEPTDLYAVQRAGFLMPKDEYNRWLAALLEELPKTQQSKPRLVLVGPHLGEAMLYQVIEAAGGCVVDDLLDVGHRYFLTQVTMEDSPVVALADRLMATLPTPTKHHPNRRRDEYLIELVGLKRADGVIFARQTFCDPHGFDYANVRPALIRRGIPHLLMDLEQTSQAGQMRTRVQAFLETIGR